MPAFIHDSTMNWTYESILKIKSNTFIQLIQYVFYFHLSIWEVTHSSESVCILKFLTYFALNNCSDFFSLNMSKLDHEHVNNLWIHSLLTLWILRDGRSWSYIEHLPIAFFILEYHDHLSSDASFIDYFNFFNKITSHNFQL